MNIPSDSYYLAFARDLVLRAGRRARRMVDSLELQIKSNRSLVTNADFDVQTLLYDAVQQKFPDHAFLGEEAGPADPVRGDEEWIWITDPIDGTDAFASRLPAWGVSLALFYRGQPLVGAFYQPATDELYTASMQSESLLTLYPDSPEERQIPLHVNPDPAFDNRTLFLVPSDFNRLWTSDFMGKHRSLGSVAAHMCVVSRGAGVGAIMNPKIWDIAASSLILTRAGGHLLTFESGEPLELKDYLDRHRMPWIMAVSNPEVYRSVKRVFTARRPL